MSRVIKALAAPFKVVQSVKDELAKGRRLRLKDGAGWAGISGRTSNSGQYVSDTSALQNSAVWACMKISAQAVSSLPLVVSETDRNGSRARVEDGRLVTVLADSPNRDQTGLEFWETQTAWLMARGNAYAEIVTTGPRLSALEPMPASKVAPFRDGDGVLKYRVSDRGKSEILPRDKVFHIKGFGQGLTDRDVGMSPIAAGTNSIGAAMAAQEASASSFANGMKPSGFFLFEQELTQEQRQQAQQNLVATMSGSANTGMTGILEQGVKWQPVSINPEDMQLLETRRFDVEEICRWFGVPPIVIGHAADGQTMWGTGVEQILISWLTLGIDPICDRIEARIRKDLIPLSGTRRQSVKFDREALLQMDSKAKAAFLSAMVQNGLMTRNEGREKINQPRVEGGDVLTAQTNLSPIDQLGQGESESTREAMRDLISGGEEEEST